MMYLSLALVRRRDGQSASSEAVQINVPRSSTFHLTISRGSLPAVPVVTHRDRRWMVAMARVTRTWETALLIGQPATLHIARCTDGGGQADPKSAGTELEDRDRHNRPDPPDDPRQQAMGSVGV
jgi:hypothetical protein